MNSKIKDESTDRLLRQYYYLEILMNAILFEDICTINEIKSLAQRLEVAKMLKSNKTYAEITEKTGASTATISR